MKTCATTAPSIVVLIFLSLFFTVGASFTSAQDSNPAPSPTPENEEIKKLKDQIELLKLQNEKEMLEKSLRDTQFPKPTTTPLAGDTTIDSGVKIETEMMAYRALSNASALVAKEVNDELCNSATPVRNNLFVRKECPGKKIAILNSQWLNGLRGYWAAKNQLGIIRNDYTEVFDPPQPQINARNFAVIKDGIAANLIRKSSRIDSSRIADNLWKADSNKVMGINPTFDSSNPAASLNNSSGNSAFRSTLASGISSLGMIGSIAGAAIDLLALLRTDTKITGLSYTVHESAFVSQVYRELSRDKTKTLFYPIEFSPNINLNKEFIILGDIQNVSQMRARGEQIVVGIEESEKGIKEATAAKTMLEERQKVLPDELTAIKEKMRELEKSFPNAAKRPRDVIIDLNDLAAKQKALLKESNDLAARLKKTISAIAELEKKRDELYNEINPTVSSDRVVKGFVNLSYDIDAVSAKYVKRHFTFEEVEGLSLNLKSVKDALAAEAKVKLKRDLTETEKAELFSPIDAERLRIFVKVGNEMISKKILPKDLKPSSFLTNTEQIKLTYATNEISGVDVKISDRFKTASLTKLKMLNKQFDKFVEDSIKMDEKLGASPIIFYLQSESLMDALGCDLKDGRCADAFALSLKVIDAGGNNRTKKNLLTMAITGDNVSHSGGAIVEYKLYDMSGVIKTSSICRAYESYRKPGSINKPDQKSELKKADCEAQPTVLRGGN